MALRRSALRWEDIDEERELIEVRRARSKGAYILEFHVEETITFVALSLGLVTLTAGWYRYYGNADNGLWARIWRHLNPEGRRSIYMVDTLSELVPVAKIIAVLDGRECDLVMADLRSGVWEVAIEGFGSSDCNCHCGAHLLKANGAVSGGGSSR